MSESHRHHGGSGEAHAHPRSWCLSRDWNGSKGQPERHREGQREKLSWKKEPNLQRCNLVLGFVKQQNSKMIGTAKCSLFRAKAVAKMSHTRMEREKKKVRYGMFTWDLTEVKSKRGTRALDSR